MAQGLLKLPIGGVTKICNKPRPRGLSRAKEKTMSDIKDPPWIGDDDYDPYSFFTREADEAWETQDDLRDWQDWLDHEE